MFLPQAKAAVGDYKEAEEVFLLIQNEKIKNDYVFLSWLARCCELSIDMVLYYNLMQFSKLFI